jgi:hypothetical protein
LQASADGSSHKYDYAELKRLSQELRRPLETLVALNLNNDPFVADLGHRRRDAEWFADLWKRFKLGSGIHLRRVHYRLISQESPIKMPDGKAYENSYACWTMMHEAARDARYLDLVPIDDFVDRRNAEPIEHHPTEGASSGAVVVAEDDPARMPEPPELVFSRPYVPPRFHIEIWAEKTTMNDVLLPLAVRHQVNLVTGAGELSTTACNLLVERARKSQRPVRILYLSDFDASGVNMPVSVAAKIDYVRRQKQLESDIQLRAVALTYEQCQRYDLPRTPIKDSDRSKDAFERRFGRGGTELDALEALHPGELRRIFENEINRYRDPQLLRSVDAGMQEIERAIEETSAKVREAYADELDDLRERYEGLKGETEDLWDRMRDDLEALTPDIGSIGWPEPREGDEDPDPLYDSKRGYVEQIDRFKHHQDKPTSRRTYGTGARARKSRRVP